MPDLLSRTIRGVPAPTKATKTTTSERVDRQRLVTPRPDANPKEEPDTKSINGRLVLCRKARGLTQKAAAKRIGITPQSLGGLENGRSNEPASSTLLMMRDRLGYDPDYVIKGQGMPLLPNYEEQIREMMLIGIFRELNPAMKESLVGLAQNLRRAQGSGPSVVDPYPKDPPKPHDN